MGNEPFNVREHLMFPNRNLEPSDSQTEGPYNVAFFCVRNRRAMPLRVRTGQYHGQDGSGMWRARVVDTSYGMRNAPTRLRTIRADSR